MDALSKEEILAQMKEKYDMSDKQVTEAKKQPVLKACSIDDSEDCLTCGS